MITICFEEIVPLEKINEDFFDVWLTKVCSQENKKLAEVSLIFTSDDYLLNINQRYLNHDYYTDIITFDYSEDDFISGDLFISIDRVRDNASINQVDFYNELNRVIVHGVLHLCGYKDKLPTEEVLMRQKEDQMLSLL